MSPATTFDAASLTKPLFARYVLELALAGEVELHAPLDVDFLAYTAAPDPRLAQITPAMVLAHHTGLPNWSPDDEPLKLQADPGQTFGYSGEGFQLLLKALQNRRGADVVRAELEQLLHRLGMNRSSFVDHPDVELTRATAHDLDGKPLQRSKRIAPAAYGNLDTCLDDYSRFVTSTFWDDQASAVRAAMTNPYAGARTLGWGWWARDDGTAVLWQNGDNPGFKHLVLVAPAAGEAMILLTNGEGGEAITDEAAARFRGNY